MNEKPQSILLKINVSKIDKLRLFKGAKGTYLDAVMVASTNSEYGDDYMVFQSVSQEERAAGKKGAIIGNAKFMTRKASAPAERRTPAAKPPADDSDDRTPF